MKLTDIVFPRQLEAGGQEEIIRHVLMNRTVLLWPGSTCEVPLIAMSDTLKKVLRDAMLGGRMQYGLENIAATLSNEARGIAAVSERTAAPPTKRLSRLLLCSNDGAERFYRHIEQVLQKHAPRVYACLVSVDSLSFGMILTGQERPIKAAMAEHKEAVSGILCTIANVEQPHAQKRSRP